MITVAATVGLLVSLGNPVAQARRVHDEFVAVPKPGSTEEFTARTRFSIASGSKYHMWRLALRATGEAPLEGLGAGNFGSYWVRHKQTGDYVTQPHSLTLQALSELGIIGALGLLAFAGAVLWAALKPVRGPGALSDLSLAVPCTGIFMAWLVQTNADWLHKLPGVTGLALLAAAILLTRPLVRAESSVGRSARALAVTAVLGALLVAGAVGVLWRADRYRTEAGAALKRDPVEAISRANSSIALNPDRVDIYVVKAAAYARQDDYRSARRVLAIAADKERHNYVPWALLGDLAGRRHHFEQARRAYLHASGLNPSDGSLATLARKPRLAAGVNGS